MDPSCLQLGSVAAWAADEFGAADLGDVRRTRRLVTTTIAAALRPAGRVTAVFGADAAGCQGAFDWLENEAVTPQAVMRAQAAAAVRRVRHLACVLVPVDGTDLTLPDHAATKGLGPTADTRHPTRGVLVMTALVVQRDGVDAGLAGQEQWARSDTPVGLDRHQRPRAQKESAHLDAVLMQAEAAFAAGAPDTVPWFQIDRAGDDAVVLRDAVTRRRRLTTRGVHDRRVEAADATHLSGVRAGLAACGTYTVALPARPGLPARVATVAVRTAPVTLRLHDRLAGQTDAVALWTVWAEEVAPPPGATGLSWMLHTTYPVAGFAEACEVLAAYVLRWRVEVFHATWKSRGCDVEATQLRSPNAVWKWSAILASVAVRLMAIRDLARTTPQAPAAATFSAAELEAIVALRAPRDHRVGEVLPLGRVVRWLAELGGYTGASSGGPPGVTVLRRGMERVDAVVLAFANRRKQR